MKISINKNFFVDATTANHQFVMIDKVLVRTSVRLMLKIVLEHDSLDDSLRGKNFTKIYKIS